MRSKFLPFSQPSITKADIAAVSEVLRSGWITTGPKTAEFEQKFCEYVGCQGAVALTSATAGMHLALKALSIGAGDEVISAQDQCYARTKRGNTTYTVSGGRVASSQDKKTVGDAHHALVFTVNPGSISEEIVFARYHADMGGAATHFAVAELCPFLRKHPALTVAENLLILGMFSVSLHNTIRSERAAWSEVRPGP
jgi:hypothetical protein